MASQRDVPEHGSPDQPYKPASVTLIVLKSVLIAMSVVISVSLASRGAMALMGVGA